MALNLTIKQGSENYTATIAKEYRRVCTEWVTKTDPNNLWLVDYMCHDFHS